MADKKTVETEKKKLYTFVLKTSELLEVGKTYIITVDADKRIKTI